MNYIANFFEDIVYSLRLFFAVPAPFARTFQIALIEQIALLIAAAVRPRKWKWIVLFSTEVLCWLGSFVVIRKGITDGSIGLMGYGSIAAVLFTILFFTTLGCSLHTPKVSISEK